MPLRGGETVSPRPIHRIDSASDPRIADFVSLTDVDLRKSLEEPAGLFIAEGFIVCQRVIEAGLSIRTILTDDKRLPRVLDLLSAIPEDRRPVCAVAAPEVLTAITGFRVHRGVLACVVRPPARTVDEILPMGGPILALEGLVDATNVGLAFRSAAAMGYRAAIISSDCADPWYRRSMRTSMGSIVSLPWARDDAWPMSLRDASNLGMEVIALSPDPHCPALDQVMISTHGQVVTVFGSEGPGLRPQTRAVIGSCARIPMDGEVDSLNVAASVAVVGYALRNRSVPDDGPPRSSTHAGPRQEGRSAS